VKFKQGDMIIRDLDTGNGLDRGKILSVSHRFSEYYIDWGMDFLHGCHDSDIIDESYRLDRKYYRDKTIEDLLG
jgi:hypothetical protein